MILLKEELSGEISKIFKKVSKKYCKFCAIFFREN